MSGSRHVADAGADRKCPSSQDFASRVRALHLHAAVRAVQTAFLLAGSVGGCVVPPDLSIGDDEPPDVNDPPIIVSVSDRSGNPFTRPGPRSVIIENDRLAVTVADNDLADVLTVWFFLDYGLPSPTAHRASCVAPGGGESTTRTLLCEINGVCLAGEEQSNPHILEIEVFDRTPNESGDPLFRAVPAPGFSTSWWWQINCEASS